MEKKQHVHTDDDCLRRIEELRRQDLEEKQLGPYAFGCIVALMILMLIGLCLVPLF